MKQFLWIIFGFVVVVIACETNKNPLDTSRQSDNNDPITIAYLGTSVENDFLLASFRIMNNADSSVWYHGYSSGSPIYGTQIKSDTGWVDNGPGWCGTGLLLNELKPQSFFKFKVSPPDTNCVWRVGMWLYNKNGEFDRQVWSDNVNN